jgi:aspartyl-tRNA(Asn)/glutamyl-tRNA(Gln) amidotransferase subunit B
VQETRGWVDERSVTVSQRSKEQAHAYRYFPEPDLPPLKLSREWVAGVRSRLPALPGERRAELLALGLSAYEAGTLTESRERADYYDAVHAALGNGERAAKLAANWVLGEVGRWSNTNTADVSDFPVGAGELASLIRMAEEKMITGQVAKEVFDRMVESGKSAQAIVEESGLGTISAADELGELVSRIIDANPKAVADYRAGKESSVKFLIGQVMRETKGRASPQVVQQLLVEALSLNV